MPASGDKADIDCTVCLAVSRHSLIERMFHRDTPIVVMSQSKITKGNEPKKFLAKKSLEWRRFLCSCLGCRISSVELTKVCANKAAYRRNKFASDKHRAASTGCFCLRPPRGLW